MRVIPQAAKAEVRLADGEVQVRVTVAAEGGKANAAVVELLAAALAVPRRCVTLQQGHKSRSKLLVITLPDVAN